MLKSVTELPFNQHVGIRACTSADGLLEIPGGAQYLNHLGTVHAGAQLALAEACSGEFLLRYFQADANVIPVVRRVDAKFKKPANGKVTAKVVTERDVLDDAAAQLANKGRCFVSVSVELHDEAGQRSLAANFEWFIARAAPE